MRASYIAVCVVLVLLVAEAQFSVAATCNASELSPCMSAITTSSPPSKMCCTKIKAQKSCLCQYLKDPSLKQFVSSPSAMKVVATCGVPIPKC